MNNENTLDNSDNKKLNEKPFQKGWQNFIDGMKDGFEKFKTSLEEETKKNTEIWEQNKEKVNKFFAGVKQDWDKKLQKWTQDMEQRRLETKEQLDAQTKKFSEDFKNWQAKTKEKWEDGLKSVGRGFLRAYLWLLLLIIPIIVILVVVIRLIGI